MRAFIAISLAEATRDAITAARHAFVAAAPEWAGEKWVASPNLHVTVKFLGDIDESAAEDTAASLSGVCAQHRPFAMTLDGVTGKPSGRARMLWVRIADGVEPARRLAGDIDAVLTPLLGLEPDDRPYTPHITLARLRRPRRVPREALAAAEASLDVAAPGCGTASEGAPTVVSVLGVSVMSSVTMPSGPVYEEITFVPLGLV